MLPASVPVGHNERGVTLVLVNQSEGGMASVPVRQMEKGVAFMQVILSKRPRPVYLFYRFVTMFVLHQIVCQIVHRDVQCIF